MPAEYLFIVRHGETEANAKGIEAGPLNYPLTKKGKKNVLFIAKKLSKVKINAVYSSPIFRAQETAKILANPHKIKVKTLEDLTETKIKPEFLGKEARQHILTDPEAYLETKNELLKRTKKAIEIITKETEGNTIVVSHGDVINALLEELLKRKASTEKNYILYANPAALNIVKIKDKHSLILYNYHRKMFSNF
jgi:broad specificity phosphatase PhoE